MIMSEMNLDKLYNIISNLVTAISVKRGNACLLGQFAGTQEECED